MSESYDARALAVEYMRRNKDELTALQYLEKVLEIEQEYSNYAESKKTEEVLEVWDALSS
ncbi:hypothetical protein [Xenorhabdus bovienii]|uniref:Uncharacterized protein n=2 Tax=Xenorhabdus bovienii TaxID=40576 RepID=A0A0B6XD91_XENBV|nr:hypothetical protein [Xenorhabdus bovienii]CDG88409.1 hypothetical protein XBFFR1_2090006 [Xenorhabdus bovienii str. feltiae France]CDG93844.1 hypothetical protein XBFFL1_2750006 [Xenorhabdus bovienii str. feltiae Florida]CDG95797.1 hypothetical protein XBP1_160007 [Xenorhabdus bovienii str. puntauvense]CDM90224.1 protein of unknown function [Xenorhabdus bovienii]